MRILVVNAGSSSLKLSLLDDDDQLAGAKELTAHGGQFDAEEVARELDRLCREHIGFEWLCGGVGMNALAQATTNRMMDSAIDCANRGWPVFPCNPSTKQPLTAKGFKDASIDINRIVDWWTRHPDAMIGVPTGAGRSLNERPKRKPNVKNPSGSRHSQRAGR